MNELAILMSFLLGTTFSTDCIQTQDNGRSGYALDSISFEALQGSQELAVRFERKLYAQSDCRGERTHSKAESGSVKLAKSSGGFFATEAGEERFDADWTFEPGKTELGSLGIRRAQNEIRIARNTPGFMRNSMLQLIPFKVVRSK